MREMKLRFLSTLVFLTLLCAMFGCLELLLRYLHLRGNAEPPKHAVTGTYVPMVSKPYYRGKMAGIPVAMNKFGLRDEPDFNPDKPASEFRILSIGDSIAFGLGVKSSDAYAKVFERKINETRGSRKYNVINAAGPGYSPSFYYMFLKNEGLTWNPDMVLIETELSNDVTDEAFLHLQKDPARGDAPEILRGGRYVVAWDGVILSAIIRGPYWYERTYTYAELSRRIFELLYRLAPTEPFGSDPGVTYYIYGYDRYLLDQKRIEYGWAQLLASLDATNELLRERRVPFLVMIMPSRYVYENNSEDGRDRFARGLVDRAVAAVKERGIPYLALYDTIGTGGGAALFQDTVHLNEKGNLVVGSALSEYLKDKLVSSGPGQ